MSWSLIACEECVDCGATSRSPGVRIGFYAHRSLADVEWTLDSIGDLLSGTRAFLDTAQNVDVDSLSAVLGTLREDSLEYTALSAAFKSGRLLVDRIGAVGGTADFIYTDTLISRFLFLPLNMNDGVSLFSFGFLGRTDTLGLTYRRELVDDLEGVQLEATQIAIDEMTTTFDSVRLVCRGSICSNKNTTIEVFY